MRRLFTVLSVVALGLAGAACGSNPTADANGGVLHITGPLNDVIMVQALQLFPFCCTEADGCVKMTQVILNEGGFASVRRIR